MHTLGSSVLWHRSDLQTFFDMRSMRGIYLFPAIGGPLLVDWFPLFIGTDRIYNLALTRVFCAFYAW
jgi:hypothetical protein